MPGLQPLREALWLEAEELAYRVFQSVRLCGQIDRFCSPRHLFSTNDLLEGPSGNFTPVNVPHLFHPNLQFLRNPYRYIAHMYLPPPQKSNKYAPLPKINGFLIDAENYVPIPRIDQAVMKGFRSNPFITNISKSTACCLLLTLFWSGHPSSYTRLR